MSIVMKWEESTKYINYFPVAPLFLKWLTDKWIIQICYFGDSILKYINNNKMSIVNENERKARTIYKYKIYIC